MTTADLFDTPNPAPRCGRCRCEVLRVRDTEIGISIDLDPQALPVTVPLPADRELYENHPRSGWHAPSAPQRRGYPLHLMHTCTSTSTRQKESQTHV